MRNDSYKKPEVISKTVSIHDLYPVIEEVLSLGSSFCLTITGDSMSPFLKHLRDKAILSPAGGRVIRRGDIVFYKRDNGQYVMHRVYRVESDGTMTIVGDAQWVLEQGIRKDQLCAFITEVIRKEKHVSCERGFWRRIMTGWMVLRIRWPRAAHFLWRMRSYGVIILSNPSKVIDFLKRKPRIGKAETDTSSRKDRI